MTASVLQGHVYVQTTCEVNFASFKRFSLNSTVKRYLSSSLPGDAPQLIRGCRNPAGFSLAGSDPLPQTRCFPLGHPAENTTL